jgi:hypothetical protein
MSKPDSAEFARQVLYHLAAIGAEVEANNLLLAELVAEIKRLPADQVRSHFAEWKQKRIDHLYQTSCAEAKIDPPSDDPPNDPPPPPFPNRGANPRV